MCNIFMNLKSQFVFLSTEWSLHLVVLMILLTMRIKQCVYVLYVIKSTSFFITPRSVCSLLILATSLNELKRDYNDSSIHFYIFSFILCFFLCPLYCESLKQSNSCIYVRVRTYVKIPYIESKVNIECRWFCFNKCRTIFNNVIEIL